MRIHPLVLVLAVTGCASVQVLDMEKVRADFTKAVQTADSAEQSSKVDFAEKKKLNETLKKAASAGYRSISTRVDELLTSMNENLTALAQYRKSMMSANVQITPMAYTNKKLDSSMPTYAPAEAAIRQFESATADFNRGLASYTAASNALAELVAAKKLYFNFDVADFYQRLQRHLEDSQNTLAVMQDGLDHIEAGNAQQGERQKELEDLATTYAATAQRYAKINQKMEAVALGAGKISSLEKRWPDVQKVVTELENTNHELAQLAEKFNRGLHDFRAK